MKIIITFGGPKNYKKLGLHKIIQSNNLRLILKKEFYHAYNVTTNENILRSFKT
jgi:hypothetical protein